MKDADPKSKRTPPLSIRLSETERAELGRRANGRPISRFIKEKLFSDGTPSGADGPAYSVDPDKKILGAILGQMGSSELRTSLRGLARQAEAGVLIVDEQTLRRLQTACDNVQAMRDDLMRALGKQASDAAAEKAGLQAFWDIANKRGPL
jgi:hypothetical protein